MLRCAMRQPIWGYGTEAEACRLMGMLNAGKKGAHIYILTPMSNLSVGKTLANQGNYGKILSEEIATRLRIKDGSKQYAEA